MYSALLAAKKCILNDRQYCILKGENYDAKNIARNLIVKYNERFDYRGKKRLLEYNCEPFSRYLLFHIADLTTGTIPVNPGCTYSIYVFIPSDEAKEQAVIALKKNDNTTAELEHTVNSIFSKLWEKAELKLKQRSAADVLKLCSDSLRRITLSEVFTLDEQNKEFFIRDLGFNNYTLDYSEEALRRIHNKNTANIVSEAIKSNKEPTTLMHKRVDDTTIYNELEQLISGIPGENAVVILGYYLCSLFYIGKKDETDLFPSYTHMETGAPPILNIVYSKPKEILYMLKKLSKVFFNEKYILYEYRGKKDVTFASDLSSPACIRCEKGIKKLLSDKAFKKMAKTTPTIIVSAKPVENAALSTKVGKTTSYSALTGEKKYPALKEAILCFYRKLCDDSTTYNTSLEDKGIKCREDSYIKNLFKIYRKTASERTPYRENKKLAKMFFYVYTFLEFCINERLISPDDANKLNKKLFNSYFKNDIMLFECENEPENEPISVETAAEAILEILRKKRDTIPATTPSEITPCIHNLQKRGECILFQRNCFLEEFLKWHEGSFPDETSDSEVIRQYAAQTNDADKKINDFFISKQMLALTPGQTAYKYHNKRYTAFLVSEILK